MWISGFSASTPSYNTEPVDSFPRTSQHLVRLTEVRLVPKVDPSLIGCVDRDSRIAKHVIDLCLHMLFSGIVISSASK